jgi:hypothetical protein
MNDPRQLNPYSYAAGNPVNFVDVTGTTPLGVLEGTTFTQSVFTLPQNTVNGIQYPMGYNEPHPITGLIVGPPYGTPPPPVPPRPPVASGNPIVQGFCSWTEAEAKSAYAIAAMAQAVVSQAFAQNVFNYWNHFLIAMISAWGNGSMISTTIPASWVSEPQVGLEGVAGAGDAWATWLGVWDPNTIFIVQ